MIFISLKGRVLPLTAGIRLGQAPPDYAESPGRRICAELPGFTTNDIRNSRSG